MSDELEFQIDDDDNRMESYYFETANGAAGNVRDRSGRGQGILDLEDGDEEGGSRESAENARPLTRSKGFLGLFRACQKMNAKRNGRDYQEEYLLLRKRARSLESQKINGKRSVNNSQIQSYRDEFDGKKESQLPMDLDEKQKTVRAKSIESKRKRLLAESIKF
jgi:hypothetical protein